MRNRNFEYILLDWDGCLAKTMHLLLSAFKLTLVKEGFFLKDEQLVKYLFGNWVEGLRYWGVPDPEGVVLRVKEELDNSKDRLELYSGVAGVLSRLQRNRKVMALITLSKADDVMPSLKAIGIDGYFKVVMTREALPWMKPDARILEKTLDVLGAKKNEALWVGNSFNDWEMGRAAGVETVIFYPMENEKFGDNKLMDQKVGARIVREFKEILTII